VKHRVIAYGDPIYNQADPRLTPEQRAGLVGQGGPEIARLIGGARELKRVGKALSAYPATQLTGSKATREALFESLREPASVLHFAGHVVQMENRPELVVLGLGLDSRGKQDWLTPTHLASVQIRLGLAVLSGCGSGRGRVLPGAGVLGLTRAWLAAGTQTVLASLWPTPDEYSNFFGTFYETLSQNRSSRRSFGSAEAASALRQTQIRAIQSGDWRNAPSYWAPFFVVGKD
jgi:CHAT domain-containing protein